MAENKNSGARPPAQGGSGLDPVMVAILIVMVYVLGIVFWTRFHTPVSTAYGYWRWMTNGLFWLFGHFIANVPLIIKPFHDTVEYFRLVDPSTVAFDTLVATSKPVNIFLLVVVILPLSIRAIRFSLKNNPLNHKNFGKTKDYNLESFMKSQESVYPHLKLYSALNMLKQGVNKGRLRMADNAKQFIIRNDLVHQDSKIDDIVIDKEKAAQVIKQQLGAYWEGLDALSPVELVLFAAFVPKAAANNIEMEDKDYTQALEASARLIKSYWNVFKPDAEGNVPSAKVLTENLAASPEYAEAKKVALAYVDKEPIVSLLKRHAYVRTALFELLDMARKTGVLPSAEFRWCKLVDRELWFTLNTTGRAVAVPEVSGIYAHYLYEMKAGHAVEKPMVDPAVDALADAFVKLVFSDIEWAQIMEQRKEHALS